jgi:hypothetical protein
MSTGTSPAPRADERLENRPQLGPRLAWSSSWNAGISVLPMWLMVSSARATVRGPFDALAQGQVQRRG